MMKLTQTKLAFALGLAVMLTGCSTVNPYSGQNQVSDTSIGAGIGTVGGAVMGALVGGGRGAIIGGALGAATGGLIGHSFDQQNEELRKTLVGSGVQIKQMGKVTQLIMASDVTFATNQPDVRADFYPTLNSVAIVLKKYADTNITITGYTDNVGADGYNQQLSEQRAMSVGDYLKSQGVNANRIFTNGMGKRNFIASNATPQGRSLNRRVVITLRPKSN